MDTEVACRDSIPGKAALFAFAAAWAAATAAMEELGRLMGVAPGAYMDAIPNAAGVPGLDRPVPTPVIPLGRPGVGTVGRLLTSSSVPKNDVSICVEMGPGCF
jgi:hypothetical protein